MDRAQKEQEVATLGQAFRDSGVVVIAHYAGLTVADMSELRIKMREAGGIVRVTKNRLAKIALANAKDGGADIAPINDYLQGQTVLGYSEDPVAAAKVMNAFAKTNEKLVIIGGAMGAELLDAKGVSNVASMPSREEVIASIAACLTAPASDIAGALDAPAGNIAGILKTIEEKGEAQAA